MTITEFLKVRIADDEDVAAASVSTMSDGTGPSWWVDGPAKVSGKFWVYDTGEKFERKEVADHIARHDPARVFAECKAKRAIIDLHPGSTDGDECPGCGAWLDGQWRTGPGETCPTLATLASVYADHPDYNSEWTLR